MRLYTSKAQIKRQWICVDCQGCVYLSALVFVSDCQVVKQNTTKKSVKHLTMIPHCTMAQALKKTGIKDFAKNDYLCSHFLNPELFQMKIFGCYLLCSFTFNLYLGMSWKQISAAVKLPKNQLRFKQAANQIEGTSCPEPLKNESK